MEEKEGLNGVTVKGDEAPESYRVESRVENSNPAVGSTAAAEAAPVSGTAPSTEGKKKRGRPRKYAADGSISALSPMPISASIPFTGDYSAWKNSSEKPLNSSKKKHKLDFSSPGMTCNVHVLIAVIFNLYLYRWWCVAIVERLDRVMHFLFCGLLFFCCF